MHQEIMTVQDKTIKCRDCGQDFVFTAGEQEFFAEKGFSEPIRCTSCRAARRNGRSDDGGSGSREREMHSAVCARCGKPTQVPFEPRGDRPVYCSDCYALQRPAGGGNQRRSGGGRGRSNDRW